MPAVKNAGAAGIARAREEVRRSTAGVGESATPAPFRDALPQWLARENLRGNSAGNAETGGTKQLARPRRTTVRCRRADDDGRTNQQPHLCPV